MVKAKRIASPTSAWTLGHHYQDRWSEATKTAVYDDLDALVEALRKELGQQAFYAPISVTRHWTSAPPRPLAGAW